VSVESKAAREEDDQALRGVHFFDDDFAMLPLPSEFPKSHHTYASSLPSSFYEDLSLATSPIVSGRKAASDGSRIQSILNECEEILSDDHDGDDELWTNSMMNDEGEKNGVGADHHAAPHLQESSTSTICSSSSSSSQSSSSSSSDAEDPIEAELLQDALDPDILDLTFFEGKRFFLVDTPSTSLVAGVSAGGALPY